MRFPPFLVMFYPFFYIFLTTTNPKLKYFIYYNYYTTRNGGWLGSYIDEERSKLRNVMRIAELVNHRIFERKWRSWSPASIPVWVSLKKVKFLKNFVLSAVEPFFPRFFWGEISRSRSESTADGCVHKTRLFFFEIEAVLVTWNS